MVPTWVYTGRHTYHGTPGYTQGGIPTIVHPGIYTGRHTHHSTPLGITPGYIPPLHTWDIHPGIHPCYTPWVYPPWCTPVTHPGYTRHGTHPGYTRHGTHLGIHLSPKALGSLSGCISLLKALGSLSGCIPLLRLSGVQDR